MITELNSGGIKTSKDYFESRSYQDLTNCIVFVILVRINGIGAVAARAFYEAGYHSVSDVAAAKCWRDAGKGHGYQ